MLRNRSNNHSPNHSATITRRLAGGPSLPEEACVWFETEAARIREIDGIRNFSVADLFYRIFRAKLDYTNEGIERYKAADKMLPSPRHQRGRPPLKPLADCSPR